jgi:hypothetical protein
LKAKNSSASPSSCCIGIRTKNSGFNKRMNAEEKK